MSNKKLSKTNGKGSLSKFRTIGLPLLIASGVVVLSTVPFWFASQEKAKDEGQTEGGLDGGTNEEAYKETFNDDFVIDKYGIISVKGESAKATELKIPDYGVDSQGNKTAIKEIVAHSFAGSSHLTSVSFSRTLTRIQTTSFSKCTNLRSVHISESVTYINDYAFSGLKLDNITVEEGNKTYGIASATRVGDKATVVVPKDQVDTYNYETPVVASLACGEIVVPSGVTKITDGAFNGCGGLTSVFISSTVDEIGASAFVNCPAIEFSIDEKNLSYAFANPSKVGDNAKVLVKKSEVNSYSFQTAPVGKIAFGEIVVPESITEIPDTVFNGTSVSSVTLLGNITSLKEGFFAACKNLETVTLPNTITSIENYTFAYCTSLKEVIIPEGVTKIGQRGFYECNSLSSITLPSTLKLISLEAFTACHSLTTITLPDGLENVHPASFGACTGLKDGGISISQATLDFMLGLDFLEWTEASKENFAKHIYVEPSKISIR